LTGPSVAPLSLAMAGKMVLYKLVVLGDGGVGKTALTIQLCLQHFVETVSCSLECSGPVVVSTVPPMTSHHTFGKKNLVNTVLTHPSLASV